MRPDEIGTGVAHRRRSVGHEYVDHTSEITLRVNAPTFQELVAEATRGFAELVPASMRGAVGTERREFRIRGADRAASLVEWLNELVYLCEVEQWLPVDLTVADEDGSELLIRARGVDLARPWVLVKAATLHNVSVTQGPRGLVAEVTLDV
jgi:SHS2 domain-containing protein